MKLRTRHLLFGALGLAAPLTAWAETGDDTADGSAGTSATASTTDTTTGASETSDASSSEGGEDCGDDCSGDGSIQIDAPTAGATVTSPFHVTVSATDSCYCDTCGCFNDELLGIAVRLDGEIVGNCEGSPCELDIDATAGVHTVRVDGDWSFFSFEGSDEIEVTVQASGADDPTEGETDPTEGGTDPTEGGTDPTEGGTDPTESSDSTAGGADEDVGCSCRADTRGTGAGWMALWFFAAFARRRNRPT